MIDSATPVERLYIWMIRRWLDGVCGQQAVWNAFAAVEGPKGGHVAMAAFEAHMEAVVQHARRRLYRHTATCSCLGADEAALAKVIDAARRGEETEAYAAAGRLVRGPGLLDTVDTATTLAVLLEPVAEDVLWWIEETNQQFRFDPLLSDRDDAAPLTAPRLAHGPLQ